MWIYHTIHSGNLNLPETLLHDLINHWPYLTILDDTWRYLTILDDTWRYLTCIPFSFLLFPLIFSSASVSITGIAPPGGLLSAAPKPWDQVSQVGCLSRWFCTYLILKMSLTWNFDWIHSLYRSWNHIYNQKESPEVAETIKEHLCAGARRWSWRCVLDLHNQEERRPPHWAEEDCQQTARLQSGSYLTRDQQDRQGCRWFSPRYALYIYEVCMLPLKTKKSSRYPMSS